MGKYMVFIGGLQYSATEKTLYNYFQKFGKVLESQIARNHRNNTSKGFGFIEFAEKKSLDLVLSNPEHLIEGRYVDCQSAHKDQSRKKKKQNLKDRRVFVSDLSPNASNELLSSHFSKFGALRSAYVIKDPETSLCKGYGFVLFEEENSAVLASKISSQKIRGEVVQVKRYKSKNQLKKVYKEEESNSSSSGSTKEDLQEKKEEIIRTNQKIKIEGRVGKKESEKQQKKKKSSKSQVVKDLRKNPRRSIRKIAINAEKQKKKSIKIIPGRFEDWHNLQITVSKKRTGMIIEKFAKGVFYYI